MSKTLSFFLGIITGVILTIITLFIIAKSTSVGQGSSNDGITMFEQPGDIIPAKKFEVIQVVPNGALATSEETRHGISMYTGPVVLFLSDGQNTYYDDEVITVPKGKVVRQIGSYQYETRMGYKTVPIVKVIE